MNEQKNNTRSTAYKALGWALLIGLALLCGYHATRNDEVPQCSDSTLVATDSILVSPIDSIKTDTIKK